MEFFKNTAVPAAISATSPAARVVGTKKRGMLPLLTVLFLISYGLMTFLIVEQGSTIESQRALIRELFRDSTELSAVKLRAQQDKAQDKAKIGVAQGAQNSHKPSAQAPADQSPSSQGQQQAPASQATPRRPRNQTGAEKEKQFRAPTKPATDQADDGRAVITI